MQNFGNGMYTPADELDEALQRQGLNTALASAAGSPQDSFVLQQQMQPQTDIQGPETTITANPQVPQNPMASSPTFQSLFQPKKMDLSSFSPEALASAQQTSNENRGMTGALGSIASAVGQMTGRQPNSQLWQDLMRQANQPMTDLQNQQNQVKGQASMQDFQSSNDPASAKSQATQELAKQMFKKIGIEVPEDRINQMSDSELSPIVKQYEPMLPKVYQMQAAQQRQDTKATTDQGKVFSELVNKTEATKSRGAVKNAWDAQRLISNAQSVFDEVKNKNLDSLDPRQVDLVVAELSKVATGGVATEQGQKDLRPPSTLQSAFNAALEKVMGSRRGADLGDFLKIYQPYLESLKKNAQSAIGESADALLTGYEDRLTPEQVSKYKKQYGVYSQAHQDIPLSANAGAPKAGSDKIKVSNGQKTYLIDPKNLDSAEKDGFKRIQ